eukprot:gnl/TRDRNA2_/TRDRNA2_140567_c0_seq1.p1 gnl/TRDRNA2_/TRDRNA2_140567_c0~~gnl/TRDRNA2_/TRDRNA2_140567_c0_seq1.p1  ORF type:complete len:348 (-),score=56.55 gnl/TRDRNA2_/TRDRNA2_140567_c0_seq1:148-1191(-)
MQIIVTYHVKITLCILLTLDVLTALGQDACTEARDEFEDESSLLQLPHGDAPKGHRPHGPHGKHLHRKDRRSEEFLDLAAYEDLSTPKSEMQAVGNLAARAASLPVDVAEHVEHSVGNVVSWGFDLAGRMMRDLSRAVRHTVQLPFQAGIGLVNVYQAIVDNPSVKTSSSLFHLDAEPEGATDLAIDVINDVRTHKSSSMAIGRALGVAMKTPVKAAMRTVRNTVRDTRKSARDVRKGFASAWGLPLGEETAADHLAKAADHLNKAENSGGVHDLEKAADHMDKAASAPMHMPQQEDDRRPQSDFEEAVEEDGKAVDSAFAAFAKVEKTGKDMNHPAGHSEGPKAPF